jgi:virginiamycin B lyase
MLRGILAGLTIVVAIGGATHANETIDPFARKFSAPDLKFPDQPRPAYPDMTMMFRPYGAGPFPALVIVPGCGGHGTMNAFGWAMRAVENGYAALVVDPLTQRGVIENCGPTPIGSARYLKDAFDAANHLRKQRFVDPARIGLLGLSLGGMAALGAASSDYSRRDGSEPFSAIVALYPLCSRKGVAVPESPKPVDMRFVRDKIVQPLLVQMGEKDEFVEGGTAADCKPLLDEQKAKGAPLEYVTYPATHSWDEQESSYGRQPHTVEVGERDVRLEYNSEVTDRSAHDAFAFLNRYLKTTPSIGMDAADLKPAQTFELGGTPDWMAITDDAIWVANAGLNAVHRIDPKTNKIAATVAMPDKPCSGLAAGFGSLWVPLCGKSPSIARIDLHSNAISATVPVGPADNEGGIAVSSDSVWIITDEKGTLTRIDPDSNAVKARVTLPPGSFNPLYAGGLVWVTGFDSSQLIAVDPATDKVVATVPTGPHPRFLTSGAGSIWTLNQGDGSITRIDAESRRPIASVESGTPGGGGEIAFASLGLTPAIIRLRASGWAAAATRYGTDLIQSG